MLAACAGGSGRQGTQIVVTGTGPTAPVAAGTNAVFVMNVANVGPYDASNVKLIDNVGNQLRLVSITCAASGGATCPSSPTVDMTLSSIPNGGTLIFSVTVQLDNSATGIIQNSMSASFAEEINPTGAVTSVTATAFSVTTNVVVSGSGPPGTLVGGSPAVFTMTVTNNGPDATGAFNVYDNVGNGLALNGITCAASGGAACPATVGVLTAVDTLPAGGVLTFTVDTTVGQKVNGTISNETVVNIKTNPNPSSNVFYATATVDTADLNVSGTSPAGPLSGGSAAAFTLVLTNNGPGAAQNINITNALSAGITASGAITCVASGGAACPASLGPAMTLASMPSAGVLTFTIPFTVNLGTTGPITDTMTVSSTTDPRSPQMVTVGVGSTSSSLFVTETAAPTQVDAGGSAVFTAVVANFGPAPASNVTVSYALTGPGSTGITLTAIACAAGVGVCPPPPALPLPLNGSMVLPFLGVGRAATLTFTVAVPSSAAGQGAIINTVTASAVGNVDLLHNVASASTTPINGKNGTYQVFAADGNQYTLNVNFDSKKYDLTDQNGVNIVSTNFTADAQGGGYTITGIQRFRTATDLIVGGQNFGTGKVIPYVAARQFGTTVTQLAGTTGGQYDLVTLDVAANTTFAATARVSGNTLSICQSTTGVAIPQNCPAGSLNNYTLSVSGNVFSGRDAITFAQLPFSFQQARIGATVALLGFAPDVTKQLFVIGLPDAPALAGGGSQGASVINKNPDWVTVNLMVNLIPIRYSYTGQNGPADEAKLTRISTSTGPFSMLTGTLTSDGAPIYVMQSLPLTVAFGATSGAASGLLQVTLR